MGKRWYIEGLVLLVFILPFILVNPGSLLPDQVKNDTEKLEEYLEVTRRSLELALETGAPVPEGTNIIGYQSTGPDSMSWRNNLIIPPDNLRRVLSNQPGEYSLFEDPAGKFMVWQWPAEGITSGFTYYGAIQVLAPYYNSSGEEVWSLPPQLGGHQQLQYEVVQTGESLYDPDNQVLTNLRLVSSPTFSNWWYLLFFLSLVATYFIGVTLFGISSRITSNLSSIIDWLIDVVLLVIVYFLCTGFLVPFVELAPFAPEGSEASYIARIAVGSVLLVAMSIRFPSPWNESKSIGHPLVPGVLVYLGLTGGMFILLKLTEWMVFDSGVDFFFPDVFHIQPAAWIVIGSTILLMFALFLICSRWIRSLLSFGLTTSQRMLSFVIAALIISIPFLWIGSETGIVPFIISAFALALLLDQFVETRQRDLTWLIVWLMVFTGFSANLIFALQNKLPSNIMEETVLLLEEEPDPQLVASIADFNTPQNVDSTILLQWRIFWNAHPYLPAYYTYESFTDSIIAARAGFLETQPDRSNLLAISPSHLIRIQQRAEPEQTWMYEPFNRPAYRGITQLDRFHYGLYDRTGKRIEHSTDSPFPEQAPTALIPIEFPSEGQTHERIQTGTEAGKADRFVFDNGNWLAINYKNQGLIKPISLFSFLFTVLFLLTPLLAALNNWLSFLPKELRFTWSAQSSLGSRIQIYVLALIVLSFLAIGSVTVIYFQRTENAQTMEQNRQRLDAVRAELESVLDEQQPNAFQFNRVARSHRQDIRFFESSGALAVQSEGLPYRLGVRPVRSAWNPLQHIKNGKRDYILERELMGAQSYDVVYRASVDQTGTVRGLYAFPISNTGKTSREQVAGFFGMLLNVYVFLLLIAGAVAIAVATSITQPLTKLRNSLTQVKLGRNEPIPYEGRDELGVLIWEYNLMLKKLEESTRQLSKTERESAWREMAKRVAHEIKNPLTPMRLSIQHLQYVIKSDPEAAQPLMAKTSETLIEQIDNLSRIASAFSNFGEMPNAKKEVVEVVELARSAHDLFVNEASGFSYSFSAPNGQFEVEVDRSQLLRVFNNLYKNAEQAFPAEENGSITTRVTLLDNDQIQIAICDTGAGIPVEVRDKVFIPEFTTKSSGSGLGLAMSKDIISAFGGDLFFESTTGEGTCFFVVLPLHKEPS